ncbi:UNVERIFIED_CONTAM: hypothetical protein NCL1_62399 [Trichonephila clavipes]
MCQNFILEIPLLILAMLKILLKERFSQFVQSI